jgi:hypothetical protein
VTKEGNGSKRPGAGRENDEPARNARRTLSGDATL